jgi:hypothetical protein
VRGGEVELFHPTLKKPPLYLIKHLTLTRGFRAWPASVFVAWGGKVPPLHPSTTFRQMILKGTPA